MTVGEAFDSFLADPEWESGLSDADERFVNVKGGITYYEENAEIVVQFIVDEENELFQYDACEINGVPQNNLVFWNLLETIYNDNSTIAKSSFQIESNSMLDKIAVGATQSYDNEFGNIEVTLNYITFVDKLENTWMGGYEYPDDGSVFLCAAITVKNIGTKNGSLTTGWNTVVYDGTYEFKSYATRLLSTLTPISSVVTKITLEKATSKQGKPYALFNFEAVGTLSPEEAAQAKAFGQQFMEIVNASQLVPELAEAG